MDNSTRYSVRDRYGNTYGPATADLLRAWVREGRIVSGMSIRPADSTTEWLEASTHPLLADLFQSLPTTIGTAAPPGATAQDAALSDIPYGGPPRTNTPAAASLILGIVALTTGFPSLRLGCCCGFIAAPAAIAAIIAGCLGLSPRRENDCGRGMAFAGLILAALALLFVAAGTFLFFWNAKMALKPGL